MARDERRLAAILAADVAGYSRLMSADESGTLARFKLLRSDHVEPALHRHGGRVVGEAGDSLLVEFALASDAVACAVEVQTKLAEMNTELPEDRRMRFRMGVNLGEVIIDGATIHGDGVNIAARLEKLADPGSLVISRSVHEQIKGKVPYRFEDMGEQALHNITEPVRAYRVLPAESTGATAAGRGEDARRRQSIAVLPFANMSGDPEQVYFSDGITEDLITALARHHGLFVIARNSSFVFKGKSVPIPEAARQLGVRYIVEGSVRKAGKRLRITAQLIDAETGAHVWAEKYDRDLEDVFTVQDEIVETLVWRVAGHVAIAELERARERRTENADAYSQFLQGIGVWERALREVSNVAREDVEEAIGIWRNVSILDPNWGRPLSHIANALMAIAFWHEDQHYFDQAIEIARQALARSDAEDWTEALIGYIAAKRGDFKMADMHIGRAMARNSSCSMTLVYQAYSLYWRGDAAGAIAIGLSVRRLDPLDRVWINELLAYAYYAAGDYESSYESFRRCMPFHYWADHGFLAACLGQLGQPNDAGAAWRQLLEVKPDYTVEKFVGMVSVSRLEDKEHWRDGLLKAGLR